MSGFRIAVHMESVEAIASGKRQCLVYVDDKWSKVTDLVEHLTKVFGVKHLEVFIDDCWVPSEEPICIIKPSDKIKVKRVKSPSEEVDFCYGTNSPVEESFVERKEKRPKKKKKTEESPTSTAVEHETNNDAVLAAKKEELLQELLLKTEATLSQEDMDVADSGMQQTKKRRHRKRPNQKRKERLERGSIGAALLSCLAQPTDTTAPPSEAQTPAGPSSSHHIRFDEEPVQDINDDPVVEPDTPKEDWQERLLALALERNKPVFVRKEIVVNGHSEHGQNGLTLSNGLNGTAEHHGDQPMENGKCDDQNASQSSFLHNSVPTDLAKTGDVLYFKKLNVMDGKPEVSEGLLGLVEEADLGPLVLKILEGKAEQAFSPDEIHDSEGGCFIVKVPWTHIIEPRLVVDTSLLSKYL